MKKKIALLLSSFLLVSTTFANQLSEQIQNEKTSILDYLWNSLSQINSAYQNLSSSLDNDKDYQILKSLSVIDLSDYRTSYLQKYFDLDSSIVSKFNELLFQLRTANRQNDF